MRHILRPRNRKLSLGWSDALWSMWPRYISLWRCYISRRRIAFVFTVLRPRQESIKLYESLKRKLHLKPTVEPPQLFPQCCTGRNRRYYYQGRTKSLPWSVYGGGVEWWSGGVIAPRFLARTHTRSHTQHFFHTHTHTHTHTQFAYTCICLCVHTYTQTHTHAQSHIHTYIYTHTFSKPTFNISIKC